MILFSTDRLNLHNYMIITGEEVAVNRELDEPDGGEDVGLVGPRDADRDEDGDVDQLRCFTTVTSA